MKSLLEEKVPAPFGSLSPSPIASHDGRVFVLFFFNAF